MIRSIGTALTTDIKNNPYLISIGEKAELIANLYKLRQKGTQETLEELRKLIEDINAARREQAEKNMPPDIFSIYWILKGEGIPNSEDKAKEMQKVLREYPHWRITEDQERKVKQALNGAFIKAKIEIKKSVELAMKIIKILKGGG